MYPDVTLQDFVYFFGVSKEEILKGYVHSEDPAVKREIFKKIMPRTEREVRSMYETDEYNAFYLGPIGDNFFTHYENESKKIMMRSDVSTIVVWHVCRDYVPKDAKILDYGCGIPHYTLPLLFYGYKNLDLVDIGTKWFYFLEYLCNKYINEPKIGNIKCYPITGDNIFPNLGDTKYQYIIISEMLEHCFYPLEVLQYVVDHLEDEGLIYISDFYDDCQGHDPSHLVQNNYLQDVNLKFELYKKTGIQPFMTDFNGILKIWKKTCYSVPVLKDKKE